MTDIDAVTITKTITKDRLIEMLSEHANECGEIHEIIDMLSEKLKASDLYTIAEECIGSEHMFGSDD